MTPLLILDSNVRFSTELRNIIGNSGSYEISYFSSEIIDRELVNDQSILNEPSFLLLSINSPEEFNASVVSLLNNTPHLKKVLLYGNISNELLKAFFDFPVQGIISKKNEKKCISEFIENAFTQGSFLCPFTPNLASVKDLDKGDNTSTENQFMQERPFAGSPENNTDYPVYTKFNNQSVAAMSDQFGIGLKIIQTSKRRDI